jgi:methyl coenzyme M reductase subunit D
MEARLCEAQQQFHASREELMAVQLREGQLNLELQSGRALLEMKDEQIASLKNQIQEIASRRVY